jgi:hypothetical protein
MNLRTSVFFALVLLDVVAAGLLAASPANAEGLISITVPDSVGDVGRETALVLDEGGNPVVAYLDETSFNVQLLHCGNAACTGGNSIQAIAPTQITQPQNVSLELDVDGLPVIGFVG